MFFRKNKPKQIIIDGVVDYKNQMEKMAVRQELRIKLSEDVKCVCETKIGKGLWLPVDFHGSLLRSANNEEKHQEPMRNVHDFTDNMYNDEKNHLWAILSLIKPSYKFDLNEIHNVSKNIFSEVIKTLREETLAFNPPFDILTRIDVHLDLFGVTKSHSVNSVTVQDNIKFLNALGDLLKQLKNHDVKAVLELVEGLKPSVIQQQKRSFCNTQ